MGGEDWEGGRIGSLINDILLKVAGEVIVESKELVGKNESSHGNGGEHQVSIDSQNKVVDNILLG